MKPNLSIYFALALVIFGCSSTRHGVGLADLTINGKKRNTLIQDRIPDYGIDSRDGCIVMEEISLTLVTIGQDSIVGTVMDSEHRQALPFATVTLQSDQQDDLTLQTDSTGTFETIIPPGLSQIQVEYIGFRTLTANLKELKK